MIPANECFHKPLSGQIVHHHFVSISTAVSRPSTSPAQLKPDQSFSNARQTPNLVQATNIPHAHPNLVSLSSIGISLPVVLLNCLRIASEICSSFACSTADSLLWSPWPKPYCCTASMPIEPSAKQEMGKLSHYFVHYFYMCVVEI